AGAGGPVLGGHAAALGDLTPGPPAPTPAGPAGRPGHPPPPRVRSTSSPRVSDAGIRSKVWLSFGSPRAGVGHKPHRRAGPAAMPRRRGAPREPPATSGSPAAGADSPGNAPT